MLTQQDFDNHFVALVEEQLQDRPADLNRMRQHMPRLPWRHSPPVSLMMVTIQLPLGQTPKESYDIVCKLTPRVSALEGAKAVLEFDPHPHVHAVVAKPTRFHKHNLLGIVSRAAGVEKRCVNVVVSRSEGHSASMQEYIEGRKQESKQVRVEADRAIRAAHDIPDIISL